jgi:excisionase family DNA binding protein
MGSFSPGEITTDEAAAMLTLTARRVRQLARSGALAGRQVGKTWLLDEASVRLVALARKDVAS